MNVLGTIDERHFELVYNATGDYQGTVIYKIVLFNTYC